MFDGILHAVSSYRYQLCHMWSVEREEETSENYFGRRQKLTQQCEPDSSIGMPGHRGLSVWPGSRNSELRGRSRRAINSASIVFPSPHRYQLALDEFGLLNGKKHESTLRNRSYSS